MRRKARGARDLVRRLLGLALVVAVAGATNLAPVGAGHSWRNLHWAREETPFTLKVGNNVSGRFNSILNRVAGDWRRSDVLNMKVVGGKTNPDRCRPTKGRVEVCNARYGDTGWLGVAGVWARDRHIRQAVVLMNDTYFETPEFDDPTAMRHVLCQEIGHTLGLDHVNGHTCMDDRHGLGKASYAKPNRHDYEQLERIYGHLDDRTTVDAVSLDGLSAADSELPISAVAKARGEPVIVEELGGGWERITYVVWVDQFED
jgi:hypothetical protein